MYRLAAIINALTTQAATAVPVIVDMKWILMESLALTRTNVLSEMAAAVTIALTSLDRFTVDALRGWV